MEIVGECEPCGKMDVIRPGLRERIDHRRGMLATVINALAISDACRRSNIDAVVMSGFPIGGGVCDPVDHNKAKQALSEGKVVIFSAGTGSPCFTTDTGAVLRGIEIGADIVFKATKVDGVYTDDPMKNPDATRYQTLSFNEAIEKNLKIMDTAAFALCREHNIEICVFSMLEDPETLSKILKGKKEAFILSSNTGGGFFIGFLFRRCRRRNNYLCCFTVSLLHGS